MVLLQLLRTEWKDPVKLIQKPLPKWEDGTTLLWKNRVALEKRPVGTSIWRLLQRKSWIATWSPSSRVNQSKSPTHAYWVTHHTFSTLPTCEQTASHLQTFGGSLLCETCVLSHFSRIWLLCDPMDCSPPGSSVHGIHQARILEWVAISSSRGSSWCRERTRISYISCTGRQVLYH